MGNQLGFQIEVIALFIILQHVPLDLGRVDPGDEVLHAARDKEGWVGDHVGAHAHVALFHEGHRSLEVLRHAQLKEHGGQAAAAERRGRDEVAELE